MLEIGSQINETRTDGNLEVLRRDLNCFARIGLQAAEIPPHGLDAIKNGSLDKKRMKEIRRIVGKYKLLYSVHAPDPLNLMEKAKAALHMQVFQASMEFAGEIGAGIVVYHAGRPISEEAFHAFPRTELPARQLKALQEIEAARLQKLADKFPEITICVENARPYLCRSPYCYGEELDKLHAQIKMINRPNVRIALDLGHLYMSARFFSFNPVVAVREARESIGHVHIHDNFGDAVYYGEKQQTHQLPFGRGDSHMPVGWGLIPFHDILEQMLDCYEGLFIMELRSRYFSATEASLKNLKEILAPFKRQRKKHQKH
jgi:sugar phosphate isomerase/epimerase